MFLKNGYEVVGEQKEDFERFIEQLEAGDPSYVIASCPADLEEEGKEKKTWYVFSKESLDKMGNTIWDYNVSARKYNYVIHSIRFKLHKKIKAKSDKVTAKVVNIRAELNTVVNIP